MGIAFIKLNQSRRENCYSGTAWKVSKYGVFSGSYFLVFLLRVSIAFSVSNYFVGHSAIFVASFKCFLYLSLYSYEDLNQTGLSGTCTFQECIIVCNECVILVCIFYNFISSSLIFKRNVASNNICFEWSVSLLKLKLKLKLIWKIFLLFI